MPKRSKRQDKTDEHEGRPADLTLASFLEFPDVPKSSTSFTNKNSNSLAKVSESNPSESSPSTGEEACGLDDNIVDNSPRTSSLPTYYVGKTKKGKLPLSCENRSKGKKVTVISNVTGDLNALLHELKKRAGCGGVIRDGNVELQGDRVVFLSKFFSGNACLKPYNS